MDGYLAYDRDQAPTDDMPWAMGHDEGEVRW